MNSAHKKNRSASIFRRQITRRHLLNGLLLTGICSALSPLGRTADTNILPLPAGLDALNALGKAYLDQYPEEMNVCKRLAEEFPLCPRSHQYQGLLNYMVGYYQEPNPGLPPALFFITGSECFIQNNGELERALV